MLVWIQWIFYQVLTLYLGHASTKTASSTQDRAGRWATAGLRAKNRVGVGRALVGLHTKIETGRKEGADWAGVPVLAQIRLENRKTSSFFQIFYKF
jgi:hypothetical protein